MKGFLQAQRKTYTYFRLKKNPSKQEKEAVTDCSTSKASTEGSPERSALLSSRDLTCKNKLLNCETILLLCVWEMSRILDPQPIYEL